MVDKSNKIFANLEGKSITEEKAKNYFKFSFKNATKIGKLYLPFKIHKNISEVLGRSIISSCRMALEKNTEFLDHHLEPFINQGGLCIKDTGDFLEKLKVVGE